MAVNIPGPPNSFAALLLTDNVVNTTTEMELTGIRIAATKGDNIPLKAKLKPITL